MEGQEGHEPVQFCSEACKAQHARAWAGCVKASYKLEVQEEDWEEYAATGKSRGDEWIEKETNSRFRGHLEAFRPDLIQYVGYGTGL